MEKTDAKSLGLLIRKYRLKASLTQFDLAELVNIDEKQVGKIERGVHYPSVPTFLKLIKVLDIDLNQLYTNSFDTAVSDINPDKSRLMRFIRNASDKDINTMCKIAEVVKLLG